MAHAITLLGIGHVFDLRRQVTDAILARAPDVVALELDGPRYRALHAPPDAKREGPALYRAVASFQERAAAAYGVRAGDEMRAATEAARDLSVPVALIDLDARQVFAKLRREMPIREKLRFLASVVGGMFTSRRGLEEEVEALTADYGPAFAEMARRFPTLKRVLLDDRNAHMARALAGFAREGRRVVAVVGDGHVDGMLAALRADGLDAETVRLRELRAPPAPAAGNASASFEVRVDE